MRQVRGHPNSRVTRMVRYMCTCFVYMHVILTQARPHLLGGSMGGGRARGWLTDHSNLVLFFIVP